MQRILLVIGLLGACNSKPAGEKVKLTTEEKAAKSAAELDSMLVDPSADVVAALGAEVYPGAKMMKSIGAMSSDITKNVDYIFFTNDEPAKVRDFYAGKLTAAQPGDPAMEKMGAFVVKGMSSKGEAVAVQAIGHGGRTTFHFVVTKR